MGGAALMPNQLIPFLELWNQKVGLIAPARAAAALAPAVKLYGQEPTLAALAAYLDDPKRKVRRLEYFVQDIVQYLPQPDEDGPLVDANGDLTDDGAALYYGHR